MGYFQVDRCSFNPSISTIEWFQCLSDLWCLWPVFEYSGRCQVCGGHFYPTFAFVWNDYYCVLKFMVIIRKGFYLRSSNQAYTACNMSLDVSSQSHKKTKQNKQNKTKTKNNNNKESKTKQEKRRKVFKKLFVRSCNYCRVLCTCWVFKRVCIFSIPVCYNMNFEMAFGLYSALSCMP